MNRRSFIISTASLPILATCSGATAVAETDVASELIPYMGPRNRGKYLGMVFQNDILTDNAAMRKSLVINAEIMYSIDGTYTGFVIFNHDRGITIEPTLVGHRGVMFAASSITDLSNGKVIKQRDPAVPLLNQNFKV